ncbi:filamentous hemagglutinin-like protein (plasmid) [Calothrix sp. NIES-4071]|nr:filamentous hemagglutinin-like protein [Calothrix sp. NIES-4071]BAZ65003.1 filamentous hemagglutinin-like protein [Calothrix sp. NIES-4105]
MPIRTTFEKLLLTFTTFTVLASTEANAQMMRPENVSRYSENAPSSNFSPDFSRIDPTKFLFQICPKYPNDKPLPEFIVTGRGSLSPSPLDMIPGTSNYRALVSINRETSPVSAHVSPPEINPPIIEAQGFVRTSNGDVELVTAAPTITPSSSSAWAVCPTDNK